MLYNICRPIIWYNDFLPPDSAPHAAWDYLAFGYFDGISVGENLFSGEDWSLKRLWEYDLEQTEKLGERCSAQIIYALRNEEKEQGKEGYEERFWREAKDEATEFPIVFFVLLQGKTENGAITYARRRELEEKINRRGEIRAVTYLTLDNSDMILVLKCGAYEAGASLINSFHQESRDSVLKQMGMDLTYSFSVAAVQRRFLNNPDGKRLENQMVKCAYIYAIEKFPGSIEKVCEAVKQGIGSGHMRKDSVLGCNDEVMVLNDVSWKDFLGLFRDKTGVLNHSSPDYQRNLIGITTIIAQRQGEANAPAAADGVEEETQPPGSPSSGSLRGRLKTITLSKGRDGLDAARYRNLNRYLSQVVNSLQKFDNAPIPDYIFQSMILPINMVRQISEDKKNSAAKEDFFDNFYEFVKELNLCVQNSIRSDRQFTQSLSFDIRIYSTPVRLNAFYNAYIYYLKKFLDSLNSDESVKHEYEFLTSVGVTDNVRVKELFRNMSYGKRLAVVRIPENQVYDMPLMLMVLGHEAAHFVGHGIRNREYRYECALKITARMAALYFKIRLKNEISEEGDQTSGGQYEAFGNEAYWEWFQETVRKGLAAHITNMANPKFLKANKFKDCDDGAITRFVELYEQYRYYSHVLSKTLADGVCDTLSEKRGELFDYLTEKNYLYWLEREESQKARAKSRDLEEKIWKMSRKATGYFIWEEEQLSLVSAIELMMKFFRECEADLMAILALGISLKDYLQAVCESAREQGKKEDQIPFEMIYRCSLITVCLFYPERGGRGIWTDEELQEAGKEPGLRPIVKQIVAFEKKFLDEGTENVEPAKIVTTMDIVSDSSVVTGFMRYLLKCRDTFLTATEETGEKGDERREMHGQLLKIRQMSQEKEIEKMAEAVQGLIGKYLRDLRKDIDLQILPEEGDEHE